MDDLLLDVKKGLFNRLKCFFGKRMIGVALAILSALSFGLSQILVRRNLDKSNYIHISLTVTIMGNIIL